MTHMVLTSALTTLVAGVLGSLVVWSLRARSTAAVITGAVLVGVVAAMIGVLVAAESMFISPHDAAVFVAIVVTAAIVGTACAIAVGRRLARVIETHADAAAQRDRERAQEATRRELVAWMSHDLRSPLAGIRAMAEAMEDGVVTDPPTVGAYHRQISEQAERLAGMVEDLLQLSRAQSGRLALRRERVTLSDVIAQALPTAAPLAHARNIRLVVDAPEIPVYVDVRELARVAANLLTNAVRFTPSGGQVRIAGNATDQDASLVVEDECGGIPPGDLVRLFDVGFRGTPARTPAPDDGCGLGLAIARAIMAAHDGHVDVCNIDGGCRFSVRLPRAAFVPVPEPAKMASAGPVAP